MCDVIFTRYQWDFKKRRDITMKQRNPKIEIYRDKSGQWRGRLKAGNREIVSSSEGYKRKFDAIRWVRNLKLWAATAEVVEL